MTMTDRQIVELIESPFWQDWTTSTTPVNPGWWNLTISVRDLKMWSRGIKANRNWKVSNVKSYFNIRGNKDSLVTQIEAIQTLINELQEGDMNQVHRVNGIIEEYFDMVPKEAETFEAMSWHDPRWAGDRENVEAKFKLMYPTYTIEDDSVDYLVYSGGASNKFHVFFLATDPAGNYHSFNAYGRIGYSPTLHHNAGPGTKGSVTQAISKKRQQKAKKGYVQQAETFEADNFGDMEYILLNMLTDEQLEEEYGDFMRDEGVGRKELPQRLQDRYRTDEEAAYLREKYLEPEPEGPECVSCGDTETEGKIEEDGFFCNSCREEYPEDFDAEGISRRERRQKLKESSPTLTVTKVEPDGKIPTMNRITFENGLVAGRSKTKDAKVGDRFVVATFDGGFPKIMDAEGETCDDSHLDGINFLEWTEDAEGPDCYITGLPNPAGDIEGEDNICEPCAAKWIYDYEGPEGEGYYRVSAMDAEGEDIPQVKLFNPVETGVKMTFGSMFAVIGLSAISAVLTSVFLGFSGKNNGE